MKRRLTFGPPCLSAHAAVIAATLLLVVPAPANDESGIATKGTPKVCLEDDLKALLESCIAANQTNAPPGNPGPFTRGYKEIVILMAQCFGGGFTNLVCLGDNIIVGAAASPEKLSRPGVLKKEGFSPKQIMAWAGILDVVIQVRTNSTMKQMLDEVRAINPDPKAMPPPPAFSPGGDSIVLGDPMKNLQPSNSFHAVLFGGINDLSDAQLGGVNTRPWVLGLGSINAIKDMRARLLQRNVTNANIQATTSGSYADLQMMITNAWAKMNDNEQFLLFIADHGSRRCKKTTIFVPPECRRGYCTEFVTVPYLKEPDVLEPYVVLNTTFVGRPGPVLFNGMPIGDVTPNPGPASYEFGFNPNLIKDVGDTNIVEVLVPGLDAGIASIDLDTGPVIGSEFADFTFGTPPFASVLNVLNATGTNKSNFHVILGGEHSTLVTDAWRTQADGTRIEPWATGGPTVSYDQAKDVTGVGWAASGNPISPGDYASLSVQNSDLDLLKASWTPISTVSNPDLAPVNPYAIHSVSSSEFVFDLLAAPLVPETQTVTVVFRFASNHIASSEFHFDDPAVMSLPTSSTQVVSLEPESFVSITGSVPTLPDFGPLPTLVTETWATWGGSLTSNDVWRLDQFSLLPAEDTSYVTNCPGDGAVMTVSLADPGSFFWFRNGALITNATSDTLVVTNLTRNDNGTVHTGIATNATEFKKKFFRNITMDDTPPEVVCPPDLEVECDEPGGAVVHFQGSLMTMDTCGTVESVNCEPASGSFFSLGSTTNVICTVVDTSGNSNGCLFTVTVEDSTPPEMFCPGDIVVTSDFPQVITFDPGVFDLCDTNPTVACNPPSGHAFPIGTTPVVCTATDASGNSAQCTFNVVIVSSGGPAPSGEPDEAQDPGSQVWLHDPVSGFSGGLFFTEPADLDLGGPLRVFLQRHYDSKILEDGEVRSALGPNWQHNYDLTLSTAGTNATVAFREGRVLRFVQEGTNWIRSGQTDIPFRLVDRGSEFLLADPRSKYFYSFDGNGLLSRIEDGRGNTNMLSYAAGRLTNVTDNLNRSLEFLYDANGLLTNVSDTVREVNYGHTVSNLTSFVDTLGQVTTYTYDPGSTNSPSLLTGRTRPEGNMPVSSVYDGEGRVVNQTDAASNTVHIGYGEAGGQRVTFFTNEVGGTETQVYLPSGELAQLTDAAGNSIVVQSDAAGRRQRITDRLGQVTEITYDDAHGFPTALDLPSVPEELFFYGSRDVNGIELFDLVRHVHADGTTNQFAFDARGNLALSTNRSGDAWSYASDNRGQLLSITNPAGGLIEFMYDANARLATSTDADVGTTAYAYDTLNRMTNVTHPNAETFGFTYDPLDRVTSVIDGRGQATTFSYDANSRLTNVTDALNHVTGLEYDALDRLVRTVDSLGHPTAMGYDPRGLLATVTNRIGFVTHFEHDDRERLTAVVNPGGVTNRFEYDDEDLLVLARHATGETVEFERNALGQITRMIDPLGQSVSWDLDAMQRVTNRTDQLGRTTGYTYDARGRLTGVMREPGIEGIYGYDSLGLLTNVTDSIGGEWTFSYTPVGRQTSSRDPLGHLTQYAYDSRGRVNRTTFADGISLTNTVDGANNLVGATWSDGTVFQFEYDALRRVTNAAASDPIEFAYDAMDRVTNTRQSGIDFGASYDAEGRLTNVTYNGGQLGVAYAYDSRDRLVGVSDTLTGHGMSFTYDDTDRMIGMIRSNGVNTTFSRDPAGRITGIQVGSMVDIRYTLDAMGQVAEADYVTVPIDPASVLTNETASFAFDAASQITTAGYGYDARGRLTNALNRVMQWDGASRLTGLDDLQLGYNAFDDLTMRVEGATTNRYFYNHAIIRTPIVAERSGGGPFTRFYVWTPDGLLLYIIELPGNVVRYPHFDQVGTTLALTDAAGAVTDAYAFGPYGRLLSRSGSSDQPFLFNGAYGVRADRSLYHMRARWYDPHAARFLSREPVWPALESPKKLNPYQFALLNPVDILDPTGTDTSHGLVHSRYLEEVVLRYDFTWIDPKTIDKRFRQSKILTESEKTFAQGILNLLQTRQIQKKQQSGGKSYLNTQEISSLVADILKTFYHAKKGNGKAINLLVDWLRRAEAFGKGRLSPSGSSLVAPTSPGGALPPVTPVPEPEKTPEPKPDDHHGYIPPAGGEGVPVSLILETPRPAQQSEKTAGLIWGAKGSVTSQTSDPASSGHDGNIEISPQVLDPERRGVIGEGHFYPVTGNQRVWDPATQRFKTLYN